MDGIREWARGIRVVTGAKRGEGRRFVGMGEFLGG